MIDALIKGFGDHGVETDAELMADIIWLARHLSLAHAPRSSTPAPPEKKPSRSKDDAEIRHGTSGSEASDVRGTRQSLPGRTGTGIYPPSLKGGGGRSTALRVPGASALPGTLDLAKALRPLMRKAPSRSRKVLDEDATVDRIATHGLWDAVLRPAAARWLSAAIVVDNGRSMLMWRDTVRELRLLLTRQGAFQSLTTWQLDTSTMTPQLYARGRVTRSPKELLDPSGRRVILIVSDCQGAAWFGEQLPAIVEDWGRHLPVALIHMLPHSLWGQTALLRTRQIHVRSSVAGVPNVRLKNLAPSRWMTLGASVPVPVLSLEREDINEWAALIAGRAEAQPIAMTFAPPPLRRRPPEGLTVEEALSRFRQAATPTAVRLAGLFAAAPLTLPIMRLIQRTMLPESRQSHLAEIMISGLLRPDDDDDGRDPNLVRYDFAGHARDRLLDQGYASDAVQVLKTVLSEDVERRVGAAVDFLAALRDPDATGTLQVPLEQRAFASIAARVLSRLGGRYARLSQALSESSGQDALRAEPMPEPQELIPSSAISQASVEPELSTSPVRHRHALLVGVNRYPNKGLDLQYSGNDVQALTPVLRNLGYRSTELLEERATRQTIVQTFRNICSSSDPDDLIVLFFSGHASPGRDGWGALLPYDFQQEGGNRLSLKEIVRIAQTTARRVLVLGDAAPSPAMKTVWPGIAFIGGVTYESPELGIGLLAHAIVRALTSTSSAPFSVAELARSVAEYRHGFLRATAGDKGTHDAEPVILLGAVMPDLVVAEHTQPARVSTQSRPLEGRRILWVDDHPENNTLEAYSLSGLGATVTPVLSTDEAHEELRRSGCDLVISDMRREDVHDAGLRFLRDLRRTRNDVPVAFYVGHIAPVQRDAAFRLKAVAYTQSPQVLSDVILTVLAPDVARPLKVPGPKRRTGTVVGLPLTRPRPPVRHPDDPNKGRFGGRATRDGLKLSARVATTSGDPGWFRITLEVTSTDGLPLRRAVTFYLHDTFKPDKVSVRSRAGKATLVREAYGAFTVGAAVRNADGQRTLLELDLAGLKSAPKRFRQR
jgi:CheY-like chemotaxis protein